jgi:translation initiation factor IF-1
MGINSNENSDFYYMAHQGSYEVNGIVRESLPNTLFRVELDDKNIVLCALAGKLRMNYVRILPGDKVIIEMTPYDRSKGRIVRVLRPDRRQAA